MAIEKEVLLEMHKKMTLIRRFEEKLVYLSAKGKLPGFLHLYLGEEAVAAGVCANLRDDDYITSTHRGHGHLLAKGGDVKLMMAELYGKVTGYCRGKGGSMHIASSKLGILGANGIVGGGLPIAAGAGVSIKYRKTDQVTVCFFGDGASSQGSFHESVNLASTWKLPVIYVNENNQFAISLPQNKQMNIANIADRATAYGIPGISVDGNDAIAVYEAAKEAVERARRGEGPTLIECKTYRWRGHSEGDPWHYYRTEAEVNDWIAKEPIARLEKFLKEQGLINDGDIKAVQDAIDALLEESIAYGEQSAYPDAAEVLSHVYAG